MGEAAFGARGEVGVGVRDPVAAAGGMPIAHAPHPGDRALAGTGAHGEPSRTVRRGIGISGIGKGRRTGDLARFEAPVAVEAPRSRSYDPSEIIALAFSATFSA